jgi:hypothetical protein
MKCTRTTWMLAALTAATLTVAPDADAQRRGGGGGGTPSPAPKRSTAPAAATTAKSREQGMMYGVSLLAAPGVTITGGDIEGKIASGFGPGVGLMIGYAFNSTLSAFAALDVARQSSAIPEVEGTFGLSHGEIGVRMNLSTGNPLMIPYATASIGRRAFGARMWDIYEDVEVDLMYTGVMFALGAGVERAISATTALHGAMSLGFGTFSTVSVDGDSYPNHANSSTSMRFRAGLIWRP